MTCPFCVFHVSDLGVNHKPKHRHFVPHNRLQASIVSFGKIDPPEGTLPLPGSFRVALPVVEQYMGTLLWGERLRIDGQFSHANLHNYFRMREQVAGPL